MLIEQIEKYVFSGHESFQCRQLWLKKGYDYIKRGKSFNDEDAVVILGVGKNMVSSIRFWLKAFNIIDKNDSPTEFGECLFNDESGYDPYLEDQLSLWLLHYQLVKTNYASIYSIIVNDFRKEKLFFDRVTYTNYIKRISEINSSLIFNENTVGKDFTVFTNIYKNEENSKDIEDSYSGILSELNFIKNVIGDEKRFYIENNERDNLSETAILFSILDNPNYGNSVSLNSLENDFNSPGSIFALNRTGLLSKIAEIVREDKNITFTDHAGIKELQFKLKPSTYSILDKYYGK